MKSFHRLFIYSSSQTQKISSRLITHRSLTQPYSSTYTRACFLPPKLFSRSLSISKMSSQIDTSHSADMAQLTATLQSFGLSEVPKLPNTYPELNPVDIYRSHIAELLAPIAGVEKQVAYNALQWTQTLSQGDLVVPVPALRLKGKKPDQLSKEIGEKVRCFTFCTNTRALLMVNSSQSLLSSRNLPSMACTFDFSSNHCPWPNSYYLQYYKKVPAMDSTQTSVSRTLQIRAKESNGS